ncbi:hypothetical protein Tco_0356949 [Tanacetum coccineum]
MRWLLYKPVEALEMAIEGSPHELETKDARGLTLELFDTVVADGFQYRKIKFRVAAMLSLPSKSNSLPYKDWSRNHRGDSDIEAREFSSWQTFAARLMREELSFIVAHVCQISGDTKGPTFGVFCHKHGKPVTIYVEALRCAKGQKNESCGDEVKAHTSGTRLLLGALAILPSTQLCKYAISVVIRYQFWTPSRMLQLFYQVRQ